VNQIDAGEHHTVALLDVRVSDELVNGDAPAPIILKNVTWAYSTS
jgi:hypothetical protein